MRPNRFQYGKHLACFLPALGLLLKPKVGRGTYVRIHTYTYEAKSFPIWKTFGVLSAGPGFAVENPGLAGAPITYYLPTHLRKHMCISISISTYPHLSRPFDLFISRSISQAIHICICIYIYVHVCIHTSLCMYTYMYTDAYLPTCPPTYLPTHLPPSCLPPHFPPPCE